MIDELADEKQTVIAESKITQIDVLEIQGVLRIAIFCEFFVAIRSDFESYYEKKEEEKRMSSGESTSMKGKQEIQFDRYVASSSERLQSISKAKRGRNSRDR